MSLIRWLDSFNIGIADVDQEHKELVHLINLVHERATIADGRGSVEDVLGQIVARVSAHFTHEEGAMLALEFPGYWAHKYDHQRLLDQFSEMIAHYHATRDFDSILLAQRLESWFMVHFRTFDARFHRFVQGGGD